MKAILRAKREACTQVQREHERLQDINIKKPHVLEDAEVRCYPFSWKKREDPEP